MTTITLPFPPSTNNLFINRRGGRSISKGYRDWLDAAGWILIAEREPEYQGDIRRRMELAENPTKRAAVAKTKNNLQGAEGTPLFADPTP